MNAYGHPDYRSKPATQLDAFEAMQPNIGAKQKAVLGVIRSSVAGLALFEIAKILDWPINCVTGRVHELVHKFGLVKDSGNVAVNPRSKKRAIIWIAV